VSETLVIPARFNGPPSSANGGYACGRVAGLLGGRAEVTLRRPPPLDVPLAVEREEDGSRVAVLDGDALVAEAVGLGEERLALEVVAPVSVAEAAEAARGYAGFRAHAYETCFVCGPARPERDGLGIFPGPVAGREAVAAPWTPPGSGPVDPLLVWAALDCPSGWAVDEFSREGVLLGRLAAELVGPVRGGEQHVVLGWPVAAEGRKRLAGSAIFTGGGELRAYARSTWLVPREA
jgi:hypothetical protein